MKTLELLKNVKTIANTKAVKGGYDVTTNTGVSFTSISLTIKGSK